MTDPTKPFTSDGCSLFPNGNWLGCCFDHDRAYWEGGTPAQRLAADRRLRQCVARRGHPRVAWMMYWGVRAGGTKWMPLWFRWGYGHEYGEDGT